MTEPLKNYKPFKRPERQPIIVMFDPSKINTTSKTKAMEPFVEKVRKWRLECVVAAFGDKCDDK